MVSFTTSSWLFSFESGPSLFKNVGHSGAGGLLLARVHWRSGEGAHRNNCSCHVDVLSINFRMNDDTNDDENNKHMKYYHLL